MLFENILTERKDGILTITINRPKQLNALNAATIAELSHAFKAGEAHAEVRAIIVTGAGDKAFVAGADIKEFAAFSVEEGSKLSSDGQHTLFDLVEKLHTPVIAAVNGFALGGGLELAMASHIRVVAEQAKMGLPEVSLGVIPGYGGTQRLARLVGKGKAFEMIMTAGMISAADAYHWGLANHITTAGELMGMAQKTASKIIKNSPTAISSAIRAVNAGYEEGVNGYEKEIEEFGICFGTADFKEGTTAFMEKRKPEFTGN